MERCPDRIVAFSKCTEDLSKAVDDLPDKFKWYGKFIGYDPIDENHVLIETPDGENVWFNLNDNGEVINNLTGVSREELMRLLPGFAGEPWHVRQDKDVFGVFVRADVYGKGVLLRMPGGEETWFKLLDVVPRRLIAEEVKARFAAAADLPK